MDQNIKFIDRKPLKDTPLDKSGFDIPQTQNMNLEGISPGEMNPLDRSNIQHIPKSMVMQGSKSELSPDDSPSKLNKSGSSGSQANQFIPVQQNPNIVAVKAGDSKRKWIIAICALIVIGAILGGVLGYYLSNKSSSSSSSNYNEQIKVPANYGKFKESIQAGQEKNLVEVIFVPKSQKIYEYKLYNNQTTTQGDGKKKVTNSLIVHTFGLVCADVTKDEFLMYIYIMDTKMYENGNLGTNILGFPEVYEKEKAAKKRNLKKGGKSDEDIQKETNEFVSEQASSSILNEYAPLSQEEIDLLATKGISAEQFYQSRYPIIYFVLDKESKVKLIHQPINLRQDIFQIYLNIIEQVTPIVKSDYYKVTNVDGSKKRMLTQYTQRMLNGEEVQPQLEASVDENGQASLNKQYDQKKVNNNDSEQNQSYNQSSKIQNGALLESSAKSDFKISDNKVDENGDQPLFKGIEMNSEVKISFVKQEDEIDDDLFNTITTTFGYMSVLVQTQEEAIKTYNAVFNTSKSSGDSKSDLDGTPVKGRMLETTKSLGPAIQKPIFRKNIASFEFGADVKSECYDSGFFGKEDICTVGLYSFFNGATMKIVEKQTRVNVSKILKMYQYIQHLLKDKLDVVKDKVNGRLTQIQKDLDSVMDQLEDVISIQKNPVLKEIYDVVENDELEIFSVIADVEILVDTASRNIITLIKDPINVMKERLFGFLASQGINIEGQVNHIQNFVVSRLEKVKKIMEKAQTTGLPTQVYEQIYASLENLEDLLIQVVDEPIKKYLDEVEAFILEQTNTVFSSINEVDKSISSLNSSSEVTNKIKKIIGTSSIIDSLKSFMNKAVKQISEQFDLSDMLSKAMKKSIGLVKQEIYKQIEIFQDKFPGSNNSLSTPEMESLLSDFQNIMDFSLDLNSSVKEFKQDITEIISSLKKLQEKGGVTIMTELAQRLTSFPTYLVSRLVSQGQRTIKKAKDIGIQMKENILNWKDDLIVKCKKLLTDLQDIYSDVKGFLKNTNYPENDPNYYKEPIFNEVKDIVDSVKSIVNYNYDTIGKSFQRFALIPEKFKTFINDLKLLGQRTMNYFNDIKVAVTTIYVDQKEMWGDLKKSFESQKDQVRNEIQVTIESEYNQNLNKKAIPEIQSDVNNLMNKDLAQYKDNIQDNNFSVENLYKDLINQLMISAEFEKVINSPPLSIPFEYVYMYPTPIGVTLKLRLYASWDNSLTFKLGFKQAVLDIGAGVNTKVTIGGEVGATVFVAEVGGYAEGVFLDTTLMFGINLKVLEKFKGSFYIDATFSPYNIKMGLYYKTIFSIQVFKCAAERRRNLGILKAVGGFLKNTVGAVLSSSSNPIAKAINKAINCLATLEVQQKRNDIFEPINIKGETYKKRLYEVEFGELQKL